MSLLSINGGSPLINSNAFPIWPKAGDREIELLKQVLTSGKWGGTIRGPKTLELGERMAKMHKAHYGVALSSGTAALHIALEALGIGPGDEVIVPAYTFIATALSPLYTGATVVFVDIDPTTLCIDVEQVARAITPATRAIIPVHFAGQPAEMDKLHHLATKHGIEIIEDCAQAHGAVYNGKPVGTWGVAGCFSFQQNKNVTAGEGGALITNNSDFSLLCDYTLSKFGRVANGHPHHHVRSGFNYSISEFSSAIALAGLERLEEENSIRRENAQLLIQALREIPGISPLEWNKGTDKHGCHLFMLRFNEEVIGCPRDLFVKALSAEGVPCGTLYKVPINMQPMFKDNGNVIGSKGKWRTLKTENSEKACEEFFYLPHWSLLAEKSVILNIIEAIQKVKNNSKKIKLLEV
jgi:dTDP-4-amino-4,6-dideoxygalactose transaminase